MTWKKFVAIEEGCGVKGIKVKYRKLGRERAMGQAYSDGLIEIDPRQGQKGTLNTLIH